MFRVVVVSLVVMFPAISSGQTIDHKSILADLDKLETPPLLNSLISEAAPPFNVPGSITHTYSGIESLIVRRLIGYYRKVLSDTLDRKRLTSDQSAQEFEQRHAEAWADLDNGGRWWERSWDQSLPELKGGAPRWAFRVMHGRELEAVKLGNIVMTTEGRFRLSGLSLHLYDDQILDTLEAKLKPLANPLDYRVKVSVSAIPEDAVSELVRVLYGTERSRDGPRDMPKGNICTGDGWNASARPSLQLRLPDGLNFASAVSSVSLDITAHFFRGDNRSLYGVFNGRVRYSPRDRDLLVAADFEVFCW